MLLRRYFRCSSLANAIFAREKSSSVSLLGNLRKKTGYSIANCKKALEVNQNDVAKAEEWLNSQAQELGWHKATKLQSRAASQGLVGISCNEHGAALVEVNCETDFVARNEKFVQLVNSVAEVCLARSSNAASKINFSSEELGGLVVDGLNGTKLVDLVALNIGQLGENIVLRRATVMSSDPGTKLACCTHPLQTVGNFSYGKYGALISFKENVGPSDEAGLPDGITLDSLPRQLCQHIIGMNPSTVEQPEGREGRPSANEDEGSLCNQEFVANPTYQVGDILKMVGWRVDDFLRFECGENKN